MPAEAGTTEMPMIHSRSETSNSSMSLPSTGSSSELVPDEAMASRTRTAEQAACDVATGLSENPRSPKALKVRHEVNRLEFACVCQINDNKYEHEDEAIEWTLSPEELDDLEEYDHLIEAERREEIDWENVEAQLVFPRDTEHAPWLDESALAALDRLADEYELKRLTDLKVLLPPDSKEGPLVGRENPKQLSTKMVRTWREKTMPDPVTKVMRPVWLRRSRYVAREYNWLNPEREGLYAPASSALMTKVLPSLYTYLQARDGDWVLGSMDVSDAFLMVEQEVATEVSYQDPDGRARKFLLGRLLPGQRDGTAKWHRKLSQCLETDVNATACAAYPSAFRCNTPHGAVFLQTHVDDIEFLGKRAAVKQDFKPAMEKHFKVSCQLLEKPGDAMTFLKRLHVLGEGNTLTITPHPKHVERLMELVDLEPHMCNKKCPLMPGYTEIDVSSALDVQKASVFRTCIGILLYMSADLIEAQNSVRFLSQRMSSPSMRDFRMLRHLVQYLGATTNQGLLMTPEKGGLLGHEYDREWVLEAFSDSDWASQKGDRKSVSSGVVALQGNVIYTSCRSQRTIALSSAEAELYASAGVLADCMLLQVVLCTMLEIEVEALPIELHMDSSAGRQVWMRSGVGRIRHLSCRVLWVQQHVMNGRVKVSHLRGELNPADVSTKLLTRSRMRFLMYLMKVVDAYTHERIGETEYNLYLEKRTMQIAIQQVKRLEPGKMNGRAKQAIRGLVIASLTSSGMASELSEEMVCISMTSTTGIGRLVMTVLVVMVCVGFGALWLRCVRVSEPEQTDERPAANMGDDAETQTDERHFLYKYHTENIMRERASEIERLRELSNQLGAECRGLREWNTRLQESEAHLFARVQELQQVQNPTRGEIVMTGQGHVYHTSRHCEHVSRRRVTTFRKCRDCAHRDGD